jgi:hypothetical protein
VVIILEVMSISGTIHVDPGAPRFSDAWDNMMRDRRRYVSVTDAQVTIRHGGDNSSSDVGFIAVDKEQVRAIYPIESKDGDD